MNRYVANVTVMMEHEATLVQLEFLVDGTHIDDDGTLYLLNHDGEHVEVFEPQEWQGYTLRWVDR